MRVFVLIIGILVFLAGVSELLVGHWWLGTAKGILSSPSCRWLGIIDIVIGLLVFLAADRRLVGMPDVTRLFGLTILVVGFHFVIDPYFWFRLMSASFFDRSTAVQMRFLTISGLIRVVVGTVLAYAALEPPARSTVQSTFSTSRQ